jgi:hypothetical protein
MAEIQNAHVIGPHYVRPTGADSYAAGTEADTLKRYDSALGHVHHDQKHIVPPSFFALNLFIVTSVGAASSADSCRIAAPFPLRIWAADVGCEAAAGATGTVDIYTDDGVTDASILDAPEDVKTGAGVSSRVAPEDGSEDVAYGTEIYIKGASGAAGALDGAQAHLYCQRL